MDKPEPRPSSVLLPVIDEQIAQREMELLRLRMLIAQKSRLLFEDYVAAMNALAVCEHELERWKNLRTQLKNQNAQPRR